MFLAAGIVLLVLGLLSGALLLLIPLGVVPGSAGFALWILFPLFAVGGYLMAASAARDNSAVLLTRASGVVMMVLALAAAIVIVMDAANMFETPGSTFSFWYVLVIGIFVGGTALASRRTAT